METILYNLQALGSLCCVAPSENEVKHVCVFTLSLPDLPSEDFQVVPTSAPPLKDFNFTCSIILHSNCCKLNITKNINKFPPLFSIRFPTLVVQPGKGKYPARFFMFLHPAGCEIGGNMVKPPSIMLTSAS